MREALFHPSLQDKAAALAQDFQETYTESDIPDLFAHLDEEGRNIFSNYLTGIEEYRAHPFSRERKSRDSVWKEGSSQLFEHGSDSQSKIPVLLVPSLVNRSYIFDLSKQQNFCEYLTQKGHHCYVLDWGSPEGEETSFSLADYIKRLVKAAAQIKAIGGQAPNVIGYCMGGTLTVALAACRPDLVHTLIALATPWDFLADGGQQRDMLTPAFPMMQKQIVAYGQLPTDTLQLCFGLLDPMLSLKKFSGFAKLDKNSEKAKNFILLEDWLNDGVPLAGPTAQECLLEWYQHNTPAKGLWKVDDIFIRPETIKCPSLCIIPGTDRIVPPASAQALADILPNATALTPALGHIAMMSSKRAEKLVWDPVDDFLRLMS